MDFPIFQLLLYFLAPQLPMTPHYASYQIIQIVSNINDSLDTAIILVLLPQTK